MLNPSPMDEFLKQMDLSAVTWLMVNETEGCELTGETSPDRITEVLLQKYPDMKVVLTLGGQGAVYRDSREYLSQPAYPCHSGGHHGGRGYLYRLFLSRPKPKERKRQRRSGWPQWRLPSQFPGREPPFPYRKGSRWRSGCGS